MTRDSSDYLTYKTKQNLNFPFYPFSHLFMPSQFFDQNKRTGVKTEQLKILTWPGKNKGNKNLADFLNSPFARSLLFFLFCFFTVKGNLFSFMARISIPTVLLGHQYNCTKAVRIGKTNHHLFSTYSWERLNFPAIAKLGHIRWPLYVKGYSFLDGSLLGQRTYSVKKLSLIHIWRCRRS